MHDSLVRAQSIAHHTIDQRRVLPMTTSVVRARLGLRGNIPMANENLPTKSWPRKRPVLVIPKSAMSGFGESHLGHADDRVGRLHGRPDALASRRGVRAALAQHKAPENSTDRQATPISGHTLTLR